jgi:hypothetical protein
MTNPTPRPALRKAEDATVHPAAPRPARSPRPSAAKAAPVVEPAPEPAAESAPAVVAVAAEPAAETVAPKGGKKKRKFGGATSDHLRVEDAVEARPANESKPAKAKAPSKQLAASSTRDDLMQGKPTDLDVEVPKALRKAAAKRAKSEGLDLQTVVIDALHAYVTAPPR